MGCQRRGVPSHRKGPSTFHDFILLFTLYVNLHPLLKPRCPDSLFTFDVVPLSRFPTLPSSWLHNPFPSCPFNSCVNSYTWILCHTLTTPHTHTHACVCVCVFSTHIIGVTSSNIYKFNICLRSGITRLNEYFNLWPCIQLVNCIRTSNFYQEYLYNLS